MKASKSVCIELSHKGVSSKFTNIFQSSATTVEIVVNISSKWFIIDWFCKYSYRAEKYLHWYSPVWKKVLSIVWIERNSIVKFLFRLAWTRQSIRICPGIGWKEECLSVFEKSKIMEKFSNRLNVTALSKRIKSPNRLYAQ